MRPVLRDRDLVLRPPEDRDVPGITAACQDPEIPRWTQVPFPYTKEDARGWVAAAAVSPDVTLLAVDAAQRVLGSFGLMELRSAPGYGEIGYWVAREARGRGVATRGVVLLRDWAAAELGLTRIDILAHRDNVASQRVAVRAGFPATGELRPAPERLGETSEPLYVVHAWLAPSAA
jgi:RimJ/RimL family protein N-acetyltransferase